MQNSKHKFILRNCRDIGEETEKLWPYVITRVWLTQHLY